MALVVPGFGTLYASAAAVLRAATTLTSSYVATDPALVMGWDVCRFGLDYVKGSETVVLIKPEGYDGTTWRPLANVATQASAVREVTKDILQLTPANYAASDSVVSPAFDCRGLQQVRCSVEYSGGSAPGTLAVSASFGRLAVAA